MANFKKQLITGAIVGTITAIILYIIRYFNERTRNRKIRFDFWKFIQSILSRCALIAQTGIVTDKFESACNHKILIKSIG